MKRILFYSFLLGIGLQCFFYTSLPDVVAHSFSFNGEAKAGMYKFQYMMLTTLTLVCCSAISFFIDSVCKKIPVKYINFPHKEYWLIPERKDFAFKQMTKWTDFFGILINLFLIFTFYLIFIANTHNPPRLNTTLLVLALSLFLIVTGCWLIALYASFRPPFQKTPSDKNDT